MPTRHYPQQPQQGQAWARDVVGAGLSVSRLLEQLYRSVPFLDGHLIEDIVWDTVGKKDVAHGLGRNVRGWFPVRDDARPDWVAASRSTAISLAAPGPTTMVWTSASQWASNYNTSTGEYTPAHTGLYDISGAISIASVADGKRVYANLYAGASVAELLDLYIPGATSTTTSLLFSRKVRLTAGTAYTVRVVNGDTTARNTTGDATQNILRVSSDDEFKEARTAPDDDPLDSTKHLRLYSARARTCSIWVF